MRRLPSGEIAGESLPRADCDRLQRSGCEIDRDDAARAVVVRRRARRARDVHAAAVGRERRLAFQRPRAVRDAVRVLSGGVHGPQMRGRPVRPRRPGVVGDLEPVVVLLDALGVRRLVPRDVRERAAVRPPGERLDAFLRIGDPRRFAAVHPQHVELRRRLVLVVRVFGRRRDEGEPVARRRPARALDVFALAHERARRAAARIDQHELVAVLVLREVGPAQNQRDVLAVRRGSAGRAG